MLNKELLLMKGVEKKAHCTLVPEYYNKTMLGYYPNSHKGYFDKIPCWTTKTIGNSSSTTKINLLSFNIWDANSGKVNIQFNTKVKGTITVTNLTTGVTVTIVLGDGNSVGGSKQVKALFFKEGIANKLIFDPAPEFYA